MLPGPAQKIHLNICNQFSEILNSSRSEWYMYCHLSLSINDESFPPAKGTPALRTGWTEFREADTFSRSPAAPSCSSQPGSEVFLASCHPRQGGKSLADENFFLPSWGNAIHARFPAQKLITKKSDKYSISHPISYFQLSSLAHLGQASVHEANEVKQFVQWPRKPEAESEFKSSSSMSPILHYLGNLSWDIFSAGSASW